MITAAIPPEVPCRHCGRMPNESPLPVEYRSDTGEIFGPDDTVTLTPRQQQLFDILAAPLERRRRLAELRTKMYGPNSLVSDKVVTVHIFHLRRVLERSGAPLAIVNYWGRGYAMVIEKGPV